MNQVRCLLPLRVPIKVVAKLMRDCWQERASQRPSFTAMLDILDDYFATL
jgi:hypothetical protein